MSVVRLFSHSDMRVHATRDILYDINWMNCSCLIVNSTNLCYQFFSFNLQTWNYTWIKTLRFAVGKEKINEKKRKKNKQERKGTKFGAISLATVLHIVNGVYLFYELFRAEPTGGPKISTRRKRRAGRASE